MTSSALRLWFAAESERGDDVTLLPDDKRKRRADATPLSEATLIAHVRAGDETAFSTLYHTYFESLWTFARLFVHSADAAKDVVQDVFLSVWTNRADWTVSTTVQAYLFGAVRNRALNMLRHIRSGERAIRHVGHSLSNTPFAPDLAADASELEHAVAHIIATLPERQRIAVELKWRYDLSWAEVGEAMGISKVAAWKLGLAAQRRLAPLRERFGKR